MFLFIRLQSSRCKIYETRNVYPYKCIITHLIYVDFFLLNKCKLFSLLCFLLFRASGVIHKSVLPCFVPCSVTNGGKTTLTNRLIKNLPNCCVVHQDDFFKVSHNLCFIKLGRELTKRDSPPSSADQ